MMQKREFMQSSAMRPEKTMLIQPFTRYVSAFVTIWLTVGLFVGCSTHQVASGWKRAEIIANGIDNEWPSNPLFVGDDPPIAVHVVNDNQSLALCIETNNEGLKRHLLMDGLTVWMDPKGGEEEVFGIHVRGGSPIDTGRRLPAEAGAAPPTDNDHGPSGRQPQMPPIYPLGQAAVTYRDTTGPLTMAMDEVRRTGIDIGVGQGAGRSLVYEFNIAYKAAPSLEGLAPGMVIGIGILSGGSEPEDRRPATPDDHTRQEGPPGGGGGPESGSRMGGRPGGMMGGEQMGPGPGGPPPDAKQDRASVWLQVQLADGAKG